ncbi:MAG: site-specific DNA-methyltransferase, partial [Phototrophicales bacterium]
MLSNMLYHGDNLIILRETLPDACVDLIYLDPPFNTNRRYHLSSTKKRMKHNRVFDDVWRWDDAVQACYVSLTDDHNAISDTLRGFALMLGKGAMLAYLVMMTARLLELCRVLKPTGSIYLHCDSAAGAQLKLLMDAVFGGENFRNEIIWHYKTGGMSKRWFGRKHDTIYFYTKSAEYTFNPQKEKSRLSHRYGFNNVDILRDENG